MAATGSRTLKLSILAETKQLTDSLKSANNDVETFGDKMGAVGKKIGAAFALAAAAAAAYAIKLGVDGVKSAIEDEAAQLRLASALKSATGATDDQIKATEAYISKMQLATGVSDTDLRASMQRLAVSTKDVSKSQDILNLAIDVSKGTGKDLATVTEALAKAYEGQDTKLARLGIGLSAADLKAMDFSQTQIALSNLYGGAASRNAETFQGRIDRLKQAFDEGKEAVGARLLPIIERLIGYLFEYGVPIINKFKDAWDVVKTAIDNNKENFQEFIDLMQTYVLPVLKTVFGFLVDVGAKSAAAIINAFGTILGAVTPIINFIINAINTVIKGLNFITGSNIGLLSNIYGSGQINGGYQTGQSTTSTTMPTVTPSPTGTSGTSGTGGAKTTGGITVKMPPIIPTNYTPFGQAGGNGSGFSGTPFGQAPVTINIGVAGDPEATARTIVDVMNNSNYRGTGGANNFIRGD